MAGSAHPGNPVNSTPSKSPKSVSRFPLDYKFLNTEQFGKVNVFFADDVVRGGKPVLSCPFSLRSYTLKSPFFGVARKNLDYFYVAKDAILPINADKVNVQPTIGDDIPDGVNCSIKDAPYKFYSLITSLWNAFKTAYDSEHPSAADFANVLRMLTLAEYFFSSGSLLAQCGYNLGGRLSFKDDDGAVYTTDDLTDLFYDSIIADNSSFTYIDGGTTFTVNSRETLRVFKDLIHDEPYNLWKDGIINFPVPLSNVENFMNRLAAFSVVLPVLSNPTAPDTVLNFGRLAAYQIAVHHFMSNDKIDYIFSAQLFRDLMGSYVRQSYNASNYYSYNSFTYNGIRVSYDALSGHNLDRVLTYSNFTSYTAGCVSYIAALFSLRRSLRYVDYFMGAKSQALAVGDYTTPVSGDGVDMLLLSREKALTRLAFATNQLGSKAKKWLEGIFKGRSIEWDKHDPAFIGHTAALVVGDERENTGDAQFQDLSGLNTAQNSTTSQFRSRPGKEFGFRYNAALPGYIIGVTYYDVPRVYTHSLDRQMMAYDRYDEFNPFMQYTGDQPVYVREFNSLSSYDNTVFGYQQKDMQYKQKFNRSAGGFSAGKLPSWFFDDSMFVENIMHSNHIGPNIIRSQSVELDKFYLSLTGWSLSSYFHFILVYNEDYKAVQPMSFISTLKV